MIHDRQLMMTKEGQ